MIKIDTSKLRKDIHFPITRALYFPSPKRKWYQKIVNFATYRRKFIVMEDYILWVPELQAYIFVPKGFIYDGASVPKALNGLFSSTGILLLGSCPHDLGYQYEGLLIVTEKTGELRFRPYTKNQLDKIFKDLCSYESGHKQASSVATFGLTLFGSFSWRENRREDHILPMDFPELYEEC